MNDDDVFPEEQNPEDLERAAESRRKEAKEIELEVFDSVRSTDEVNPIDPVRLNTDDTFCFSCHKGVSCWNVCCHGTDITLTPNDILRLCQNLGIRPKEFLQSYTVPAIWEKTGLPVAKLKMGGDDGKGACPLMTEEGCSVYPDRPATCRYYPLGLLSLKIQDSDRKEDFHFLVKESYCRGHNEDAEQTVGGFREQQGVEEYDRVNRGWIDIHMKAASWKTVGGPFGREMKDQVRQMFFMVSTDVDALRRFVFETKFLESYEIDAEAVEMMKTDDQVLLLLGFDWMKNVMFNEPTITLREQVLKEAIAKAREAVGAA